MTVLQLHCIQLKTKNYIWSNFQGTIRVIKKSRNSILEVQCDVHKEFSQYMHFFPVSKGARGSECHTAGLPEHLEHQSWRQLATVHTNPSQTSWGWRAN